MKIRCFIAVKVPDIICRNIYNLQQQLMESSVNVRWVHPQNFHLTLRFLGNIDDEQKQEIIEALKILENFKPFALNFAGVGGFPHEGKLRVIWVGVGRGHNELISIHRAIEDALKIINFPEDKKPFHPHLTIGRVKDPKNTRPLRLAMENQRHFSTPDFSISSATLFKSQLTPSGPVYTTLDEFKFQLDK